MDFIGTLTTLRYKEADRRALIIDDEKKNRALSKIPDFVTVSASLSLKRDPGQHRRLFKAFKKTVDNLREGFTLPPDRFQFECNESGYYSFRQWLKKRLSFTTEVYWMENGELKKSIEPRSLELDKCSASDFEQFYEAAMSFMATLLGKMREEFERELFD